jgi:hypothetical protein
MRPTCSPDARHFREQIALARLHEYSPIGYVAYMVFPAHRRAKRGACFLGDCGTKLLPQLLLERPFDKIAQKSKALEQRFRIHLQ